jgi:hypothetical protein
MTEQNLLNAIYEMYESDNDHWATTDAEYITGRTYCNRAIARWERYDNTLWRELWGTLTAAADGDKTTTAGDYTYDCPTNMRYPASYVRTVNNGTSTYFKVIKPEEVALMDDTSGKWCYFTGSIKDGFTLNFNPDNALTTGDTITYEYYKQASTFTTTTSETEMDDDDFIVYFVLSRLFENDGEDGKASKAFQEAEDRLENMRVRNMSAFWNQEDAIQEINSDGFGV